MPQDPAPHPAPRPGIRSAVRRALGRWVAPAYLIMSLVMLPWVIGLVFTLPDRVVSQNYRLAWVGFDVLLLLSMLRTAWLAWRRSPFVVNVASATATLLVVDAWFDVTTASEEAVVPAAALAICVELPLAALSLLIAGRAQDEIARTGARRPRRGLEAVLEDPVPGTPVNGR